MKKFLILLLVFPLLFSCKKEMIESRSMIIGKWNWQSSLQDNGTKMLPRDNSISDSNFVVFTHDNFTNKAGCVIGGPNEGNYKLKEVSNKQILIFKSPNTRSDTFYVTITNTRLDLTEVYKNYSWTHTFIKRNN